MKRKIYFADLTHTAQGISAATFPLGISFVVSYAVKELGNEFDFRLFKFPIVLEEALREAPPAMLCLSNYSWNLELAYTMATLAKQRIPGLIVVFGGPNFPLVDTERLDYLKHRPTMDFYVQIEGEVGFVDLIRKLTACGFDAARLKSSGEKVLNTSYIADGKLVSGGLERIRDINVIPSPYLTGILDPFFDMPLVPMLETARGCPFSCTFCSDGVTIKNKVSRFTDERTHMELEYIADRVRRVDEIIITDLNFGMYKEDLDTCRLIADLQEKRGWPVLVKGSAGKNRPERTIEAATILKGSWVIGAAIQSSDDDVLKAIKRSNISSDAFRRFIEYGNSLGKDSQTYSEIIVGMPGDTKEKHFESLNFGVKNGVNSLRMYQAMMLCGTEMASLATRAAWQLQTRFRTIPGCVGIYDFFGERHSIAEIEEIIVGSKTMPFDDYIDCRVMNLIIETFYNNALFEEVFALLKHRGIPVFDCLLQVKNHPEWFSPGIRVIISDFIEQTSKDLYPTMEEARSIVLTPEIIDKYIGGELGINELLVSKARLYSEMGAISKVLFAAARECLNSAGRLSRASENYLAELERFNLLRKRDAITCADQKYSGKFSYDFKAIAKLGYEVDPDAMGLMRRPVKYTFYHDESQRHHLANQIEIYSSTPIGIGRLIQRSNLKLIYRRFKEDYEVPTMHGEVVSV